jgi:hypothetical protein
MGNLRMGVFVQLFLVLFPILILPSHRLCLFSNFAGVFLFTVVSPYHLYPYLFFFFILLGLATNFTHNQYGLFDPYTSLDSNHHTLSNCTFSNITSTSQFPAAFMFLFPDCPVTMVNNTFLTLTGSSSLNAAVGYIYMNTSYAYIFEGNTICNITGSPSALRFGDDFESFSFTNNSFRNISSSNNAGVFFFFFPFFL